MTAAPGARSGSPGRRRRLAVRAGVLALMVACALPAGAADTSSAAKVLASGDAAAQVNYASILFYDAVRLINANPEQGTAQFLQIQNLLQRALQLTEKDDGTIGRNLIRSQAAFLLGEVHRFVVKDQAKAREYYELALAAFPGHTAAAQALERAGASSTPNQ